MKPIAAALSEADMKNVAAFYASKQAKPGFAKNKDLVGLGEKIYRGGVAERSVPACSGCHGPNGAGIPAQYPRLAGQHADYAEAQLVAFRSGARAQQPGHDRRRGQAERPRDQGRLRLRRRPALIGRGGRRPARLRPARAAARRRRRAWPAPPAWPARRGSRTPGPRPGPADRARAAPPAPTSRAAAAGRRRRRPAPSPPSLCSACLSMRSVSRASRAVSVRRSSSSIAQLVRQPFAGRAPCCARRACRSGRRCRWRRSPGRSCCDSSRPARRRAR